jgi:hypothetical protein
MRIATYFAFSFVGLCAWVTPSNGADQAEVDVLVSLLAGEYTNLPQVRAARSVATDWDSLPVEQREIHHMFATPVDMPNIPGATVYIEWRHDNAAGAISGQRVWAYSSADEGIVMKFYTLRESARASLDGVVAPDPRTRMVTLADLRGYPEGCDIIFRASGDGFVGQNESGACSFPQRDSPDTMKVDAVLSILPDLHGERTYMWFAPPGQEPVGDPHVEDWVYMRVR